MGLLAYWLRELARSQAGAEYAQNSFPVVNEFPSNSKFGLTVFRRLFGSKAFDCDLENCLANAQHKAGSPRKS